MISEGVNDSFDPALYESSFDQIRALFIELILGALPSYEDSFSFADMFLYVVGLIALLFVYRWFRELGRVPNKSEKFVYITGCDTGFGNLLARHLDTKGFRVIAGCYTEKGEDELKKACSEKLTTLHLDVTDNDSIKKAADTIKTLVGQKGESRFFSDTLSSISSEILKRF